MKKLISFITAALVLSLCLCPLSSLAAGTPAIEVSSAQAAINEGATITISLKDNPGITSAKLKVKFDSALTLKSVEFGEDFKSNAMTSPKLTSPVTLNWASGITEVKGNSLFATLTFAANDGAKAKDYDISVSYNAEDVFNLDDKNITFKTVNGKLTVTGEAAPVITGDSAPVATEAVTDTQEGDYVGPEITFDEDGNVIEEAEATDTAEEEAAESSGAAVWFGIAAAAVIIAAAVVVYVLNAKKNKNEPIE